jgi:hypothetical protein
VETAPGARGKPEAAGGPRPPEPATAPPRGPTSLRDVHRLHAELAGGGKGLAPTPRAPLGPEAFRVADQDGDGLLSQDEFVVGYHRSLVEAGETPPADLAAEATRLLALGRARRAPSRTAVQPAAPVRTLIPPRTQRPTEPAGAPDSERGGSERGGVGAPANGEPAAGNGAPPRGDPRTRGSRPAAGGEQERGPGPPKPAPRGKDSRPTRTGRPQRSGP